ncbi:MAG TPA: aromatic ring-hydroxylating dioxygenase subunit alpha [Acidimicrobiales bacterium]|nr:aromatic ring-hydroxylating dioxygenase subunit alpha [Acidimicrobiales bacterium]
MSTSIEAHSESANEWNVAGEERVYRSLRRYWHPVLYSADLGTGPQRVVLLDQKLVVVRLAGEVRVFADRCAHRGTAVSLGWVEDDVLLRCPYHGWTYGPDGVCTSIPARFGTLIPPNARLEPYRAVERHGLVYVSLDPQPILPIPDFPEFDDPAYRVAVVPPYDWQTGAARRTENFVDFAHFAWVHDGVLASRDQPEVPEHEVWRDGAELRTTITVDEPASTDKTQTLGLDSADDSVPGRRNYRVALPFTVWLQQHLPGGNTFVLFMACSPVGMKHCRSFTFNARNFALDEDDERFVTFQQEIAEADRVISESQTPEELPADMTAELFIRGVDRLSVEYRRWLFELAKAADDA